MSNKNNNLPLGVLLHNAGLISSEQLQNALALQSKYTKMKLGEILVLQEVIKDKTIDFFVNKWREVVAQGQQFPIGYYLKNAYLLSEEQIQTILKEQKSNKQKFGTLAVQKGWIKQNTLKFFLDNLSFKPPQPISLRLLEQYDSNTLDLKSKYVDPSLILSRILAWTGGNSTLAKIICHVFANSNFNIPAGLEANAVDQFIEGSLIRNWQTSKVANYIRYIRDRLLNDRQCDSKSLLKEYQEILLSGSKKYQQTKEEKELLTLGLIVKEKNQLKIANLIYQKIFNRDWITQQLDNLTKKTEEQKHIVSEYVSSNSLTKVNKARSIAISTDIDGEIENFDNSNVPEPLTKVSSLITSAAIILLIPLFLAINNYYSSFSKEQFPSEYSTEAEELGQFCDRIDFNDLGSSVNIISQLERSKQELLRGFFDSSEVFPDNCEAALNRLRVATAPKLGRESRVLEAIKNLCKVPVNSESFSEAKIWLNRWYNSPSWGKDTKSYVDLIADCPANINSQQ